jgi:hypothetical protein
MVDIPENNKVGFNYKSGCRILSDQYRKIPPLQETAG